MAVRQIFHPFRKTPFFCRVGGQHRGSGIQIITVDEPAGLFEQQLMLLRAPYQAVQGVRPVGNVQYGTVEAVDVRLLLLASEDNGQHLPLPADPAGLQLKGVLMG